MKLVTTWFGVFIIEDEKVLEHTLFPKDPDEISQRMKAIENNEILPEEEEMASGKQVFVGEERLELLGELQVGEKPFISPEDYDFPSNLLNKAMIQLGKDKVREGGTPDEQIIQAIRAIDDLTKNANLLSERLHEWHDINFPELAKLVSEEKFAALVAEHGDRQEILTKSDLEVQDSMGSDIGLDDSRAMKDFAQTLVSTMKAREDLEKYIQKRMKEVARNMAHIAGPMIGARLISLAGGLERLSKMPTSTVQILGAEKAFFKHIKDKVKPPKHGIIFQHPAIHRAPHWQRGNISRALASKISLAAKMDYFGKDYIGEKLEEDFQIKVNEIKKKYPNPPSKR